MGSLWGSFQWLGVFGFFDELRNTEAWNKRQTVRGIWIDQVHVREYPKAIEDVPLRVELPCLMWKEFLQLDGGTSNSLREFCTLHKETLPLPKKCESKIGRSLENVKNFISVQMWTNCWGNMQDKSDPQIGRWCQVTARQLVCDWSGRGLRLRTSAAQPIRKELFVKTLWLTSSGTSRVLRELLFACCYGSPGSKLGRTWRK
jgi:hypothetical protein